MAESENQGSTGEPTLEGSVPINTGNNTGTTQDHSDEKPGASNPPHDRDSEQPTGTTGDPNVKGPGTGDGIDDRPLGDPNAPQGTPAPDVSKLEQPTKEPVNITGPEAQRVSDFERLGMSAAVPSTGDPTRE